MKALILAAGYATRLRPLTDDVPKQLLPVGGRPMLDWILDKLRAVEEIDRVHLVTNRRFAPDFARWAEGNGVVVHDDGTETNETRLGAVGDLELAIERGPLDDDLLVVAGDNLFDFGLDDLAAYWRGLPGASVVALYDCGDLELATHLGIVEVDGTGRITYFVEKPSDPPSTLAATATYLFPRAHVALVARYLAQGHSPDNIGSFVAWLCHQKPLYGYRFEGRWYDIGNREQLLEADNLMRERAGLPQRDEYALD
ncbi:MAG TPA: nucleotidyltransferase family protein [Gaiellaceae bacterium]|nr:nucleotidyltransferase family protein [Gaiellaceae bacterium]